jgi:hypothetical protein
MSREVHVRFCERPEVKFLRPTHPYVATWAGFDRRPVHRGGLVHHSDRGSQGRFKWSSQRLMRSYDDQIEAASLRSFW